jgi:hypothetical protein
MLACDQDKKVEDLLDFAYFKLFLIKCYFNVTFVAKCEECYLGRRMAIFLKLKLWFYVIKICSWDSFICASFWFLNLY